MLTSMCLQSLTPATHHQIKLYTQTVKLIAYSLNGLVTDYSDGNQCQISEANYFITVTLSRTA